MKSLILAFLLAVAAPNDPEIGKAFGDPATFVQLFQLDRKAGLDLLIRAAPRSPQNDTPVSFELGVFKLRIQVTYSYGKQGFPDEVRVHTPLGWKAVPPVLNVPKGYIGRIRLVKVNEA